jgi:hypothetical protein
MGAVSGNIGKIWRKFLIQNNAAKMKRNILYKLVETRCRNKSSLRQYKIYVENAYYKTMWGQSGATIQKPCGKKMQGMVDDGSKVQETLIQNNP